MSREYSIECMQQSQWPQVRSIYSDGLAAGLAAFTITAPGWVQWNAEHLVTGRLVACNADGTLQGWAALSPVPDT